MTLHCCAVREIEPCMFCRFYRDNEIVIDILFRLVYSSILIMLFFTIIAGHHHHHSRQTTPRRPVASQFHVISFRIRYVVHQRNCSDENAGGNVGSVHSLPGPDDHGSDRFVGGARVLLHWPLLQPGQRYVYRHDAFSVSPTLPSISSSITT